MKLTYSVRPVLRVDKARRDGTCPIYFSVRVGAVVTRIPSGKHIEPKSWDKLNNCPKRTTQKNTLLTSFLNRKICGFEEYMLERESLGKPITLKIACDYFHGVHKITFFGFWEEQIRLWEMTKENNTLKSYRSTLNIFREFGPNLNFGDLTYDCIQRFDLYMRQTRGNSTGGCFTKHKCLKAVIRQAIMKGHIKENPYQFFKIKSAEGKRMFLSIEEVNKLATLEIPESNGFLNRVRDLFLFSCYTGLRYSDVMNLRVKHLKSDPDRIEITIIKTGKSFLMPLSVRAMTILAKYTRNSLKTPEMTLLPKMANQVINRELKVLMNVAQINKDISFHCARHTFASNHVEANTSLVHLKDLLGHSDISDTLIYSKSLNLDLFKSVNNLETRYEHSLTHQKVG